MELNLGPTEAGKKSHLDARTISLSTGIQLSALVALSSFFVWLMQPLKQEIAEMKADSRARMAETRSAHESSDMAIKNNIEKLTGVIEDLKVFRGDSMADRASIHQSIASLRQEASSAETLNATVHSQIKDEIERDKREHKEVVDGIHALGEQLTATRERIAILEATVRDAHPDSMRQLPPNGQLKRR